MVTYKWLHNLGQVQWQLIRADPGFSERGSEQLKGSGVQPQELISCIEVCILKTPKSSIIQGCDHEHIIFKLDTL